MQYGFSDPKPRMQFGATNQSGSTLVESAMAAALILSVLLGAIFTSLFCFQWVGLQYSAYRTIRYASIGIRNGGYPRALSLSEIQQRFLSEARRVGLKVDPQNIVVCYFGDSGACQNVPPHPRQQALFNITINQKFAVPSFPKPVHVLIPVVAWGRTEPSIANPPSII